MNNAKQNPPLGNRGQEQHGTEQRFTSNNTSRTGHINLDSELSVIRCLMSAPAADMIRTVENCGLVQQDFYAEHRRVIYNAVMVTARRAVQDGQATVQVSPAEVMAHLQYTGRFNDVVQRDFIQASAGDSMSGSVDNLWVLARRVDVLKLQRVWRGAEHLGTLFLDVFRTGNLEHLDKALEQVGHLQALRDRLAKADSVEEVA